METTVSAEVWTARALWDSQQKAVTGTIGFSVRDWKRTNGFRGVVRVGGRPDLFLNIATPIFLGSEEDWGPAGVDYSDVYIDVQLSLRDAQDTPIPTTLLVELEGIPAHKKWEYEPQSRKAATEHTLSGSVGGIFHASFLFTLTPVSTA